MKGESDLAVRNPYPTVPAVPSMGIIVFLCFAAAVIEGFDLQVAGVAAPSIIPALGIAPAQLGLFFSAATFGLIIGALIGGRVADRYGRKPGLLVSLATFGLFSLGTGFAWNYDSLLITRFLTGLGLGGALPNLVAIAAEASRPERRRAAVGAMYAGLPFGGAICGLLSYMGFSGKWWLLFMIGGSAPFIVAPLIFIFLPNLRAQHLESHPGALGALFGRGNVGNTLLLWGAFFLSLLVLYLLLNWLPVLLVSRGFDKSQAGAVQFLFNLCGAAASPLAGRAMDGAHGRRIAVASYILLIAALVFLALMPRDFATALVAGSVVGTAIIAIQAILYGLAPACYPMEVRGTGVASAVAVGRFGSVAGPLVAGGLIAAGHSSTEVLLVILPVAAAAGVFAVLLVRRLDGTS